jgi:hypothetical protein
MRLFIFLTVSDAAVNILLHAMKVIKFAKIPENAPLLHAQRHPTEIPSVFEFFHPLYYTLINIF